VQRYISEAGNADEPGRLVAWLYPRMPVLTWRVPGLWLDIGSHEALASASTLIDAAAHDER
jgi:hypothetical protein